MIKNRWLAKTMLTVSLASFCSAGLAKSKHHEFFDGQTGIASYFSDKFHGKRTACGEPYNMNALTAAHASLPFGTLIHVVNLKNNQSVDVRINSRSHRANKRLLDLSKEAARQLGFLRAGIAMVKVTVVRLGEA